MNTLVSRAISKTTAFSRGHQRRPRVWQPTNKTVGLDKTAAIGVDVFSWTVAVGLEWIVGIGIVRPLA
jgi:hypothetical protein